MAKKVVETEVVSAHAPDHTDEQISSARGDLLLALNEMTTLTGAMPGFETHKHAHDLRIHLETAFSILEKLAVQNVNLNDSTPEAERKARAEEPNND
jgi:hypothetical protein